MRAASRVASLESRTVRQPAPLLYDLTELQRHANQLFGFSAAKTLELAQELYEKHMISYPRTDSSHLSLSVEHTLKEIVEAISGPYREQLRPGTGETALGKRYVDDTKVTDHHAILPTNVQPNIARLGLEEHKIYDLICRRLLALWQGDYVTAVTTVLTVARTTGFFRTQGTMVVEPGWEDLDPGEAKKGGIQRPPASCRLNTGVAVEICEVKPQKKTTRPPPFLNDASLLAAMESAGRTLEDRELQLAMRDSGLGTPATRAGIIETLINMVISSARQKRCAQPH